VKLLFIQQNALFRLFVLLRTVFIDEAIKPPAAADPSQCN
jgi:hypothetical protein